MRLYLTPHMKNTLDMDFFFFNKKEKRKKKEHFIILVSKNVIYGV